MLGMNDVSDSAEKLERVSTEELQAKTFIVVNLLTPPVLSAACTCNRVYWCGGLQANLSANDPDRDFVRKELLSVLVWRLEVRHGLGYC